MDIHIQRVDFDFKRWSGPNYSRLGLVQKPILVARRMDHLVYIGSSAGHHYFTLDSESKASITCYGSRGISVGGDRADEILGAVMTCHLDIGMFEHTQVSVTLWEANLPEVGRMFSDVLGELKGFTN